MIYNLSVVNKKNYENFFEVETSFEKKCCFEVP